MCLTVLYICFIIFNLYIFFKIYCIYIYNLFIYFLKLFHLYFSIVSVFLTFIQALLRATALPSVTPLQSLRLLSVNSIHLNSINILIIKNEILGLDEFDIALWPTYQKFSFEPFKAQLFLYVPPGLTSKSSTWCSLCSECFVRISEQIATFAVYIINWLVL